MAALGNSVWLVYSRCVPHDSTIDDYTYAFVSPTAGTTAKQWRHHSESMSTSTSTWVVWLSAELQCGSSCMVNVNTHEPSTHINHSSVTLHCYTPYTRIATYLFTELTKRLLSIFNYAAAAIEILMAAATDQQASPRIELYQLYALQTASLHNTQT